MMRSLDQRLPAAPLLLLLSGIACAMLLTLIARLPAPLNDPVAHLGLQLAVSTEALQGHAAEFARSEALADFFRLDTAFPLAYALFLGLLCSVLARVHQDSGRRPLARSGIVLGYLVLLCAPLDWLENHWLAQVITQAPGMAQWYVDYGRTFSATPKYILLITTLAWLAWALLNLLRGYGRDPAAIR